MKSISYLKGGLLMSDFMKWLYAHYIRPQIDAAPQGDYEFWFSLMDS